MGRRGVAASRLARSGDRGPGPGSPRGAERAVARYTPFGISVDVPGPAQPARASRRRWTARRPRTRAAGRPAAPPGPPAAGRPAPARPGNARRTGGVHVVHDAQHRRAAAAARSGVKNGMPFWQSSTASNDRAVRQQPAQHPRVHGEPAAQPDDLDPVPALPAGLPGRAGGEEADRRAAAGQAAGHLPGVPLGAARLRVPGITPVDDGDAGAAQVRSGAGAGHAVVTAGRERGGLAGQAGGRRPASTSSRAATGDRRPAGVAGAGRPAGRTRPGR